MSIPSYSKVFDSVCRKSKNKSDTKITGKKLSSIINNSQIIK